VASNGPQPPSILPPWESLSLVDKEKRWLFVVRYHVLQDNKPDEIKKGQEIILGIRKELEGVFDFRAYDRRCHDTRIAKEINNTVAPLPNKQVL
jgi:mediator of RNA polymerase II transcription subunit 18, fungi type